MKIIPPKVKPCLSEAGQNNPLRWNLLFRTSEEGVYESQTGIFKCKDYFNDIVAKYQGLSFHAHGLDTTNIQLNEEGTPIELSSLSYTDQLLSNLQVISNEAEKFELPPLPFKANGKDVLLFIPREYYKSTYIISFLTYCIRISHCPTIFSSFDDLVKNVDWRALDNPFGRHYDKIMAERFEPPIKGHTGWEYLGKRFTGTVTQALAEQQFNYAIHNNGCCDWQNKAEGGI